jgi:hypothetical protein
MSLREIREERKKLGVGVRRSMRTRTLVLLFIIVALLLLYLDRVG